VTTTQASPAITAPRSARGGSLLRARELAILIVILVVFGVTTLRSSHFADAASVQELLSGAAIYAILCVGETLVIVTRNYDLSVGSVVGLSAYVIGGIFVHDPHFPILLGFVVGIAIGAVVGAVNGFITVFFRVPSLVVTLAMLYVVRGIDGEIINGVQINPDNVPRSFTYVGYKNLVGVPWIAIIAAVIVLAVGYAMRTFRSGRDLYAIGSNPDAAALAGVPTARRVFTAFLVSGILAGFCGALFLSQYVEVDVTAGLGFELTVIAGVVVGGVAIFGGSGTVFGAALGALLLNTINQALVAARVASFWDEAVAGALMLAAISFDRWLATRVSRRLRTAEGAHRDI
jgi:rhamnose transport system permease protein